MADHIKIRTFDDNCVHFDTNSNNYTLCGLETGGDQTLGIEHGIITTEKVDCPHCISIVKFCHRIKKSEMRILTIILLLFLSISTWGQLPKQKESYYRDLFAPVMNGQTEVVLRDKARVDIVTDTFAIEVDFAPKWAEAIGQSLYYADRLNKKPAILFVVDGKQENRYIFRLLTVTRKYGITVWILDYNTNKFGKTK